MYPPNSDTKILNLSDVPESDPNDPQPHVFRNEHSLFLIFCTNNSTMHNEDEVAVISFSRSLDCRHGGPNEEAIEGHPLFQNGLGSYMAVEIKNSPWIAQLEEMNRVHPRHNSENYKELKHYIFTFHDSTFECIAEKYSVNKYKMELKNVIEQIVTNKKEG